MRVRFSLWAHTVEIPHMIFYSALLSGTAILSTLLILSHSAILSIVLWIFLLALFYIHLEPYFLKVKKLNLKISGLKKPLKIVFIADLQVRKFKGKNFLRRVINTIIKLKPELVLLGGDIISNEYSSTDDDTEILSEFSKLTKEIPAYGVLGNHDHGVDYDLENNRTKPTFLDRHEDVINVLKKSGVNLLQNSLTRISLDGENLELYGTDDLWAGNASWENIKFVKNGLPLLVLAHNPDTILTYPEETKKPSLVLSGHTHGGQIRLPIIGPIGNAKLKLGRKFYQGFLNWHEIPLFVTNGLGESTLAIRFLARPEIVEITLLPLN